MVDLHHYLQQSESPTSKPTAPEPTFFTLKDGAVAFKQTEVWVVWVMVWFLCG
ncbi:hypothetical protein AVEN_192781-1, partial [Araneus ventricosus]